MAITKITITKTAITTGVANFPDI